MQQRVFLLGYRASGKSTVAPLLAAGWSVPCLDSDTLIAERAGCDIATIFADRGEAAFRLLEADILRELLADAEPAVVATGGGCVVTPATREALAASPAPVVYLHAPAAVLQRRLRLDAGGRPSLSGADVADEVPAVLAEREPWYRAAADVVVDATAPVESVVAAIRTHVENPTTPG